MTAERSLFRFLNWSQECGPKQPKRLGKKGKEEEKPTRRRTKRKERRETSEIEEGAEEGEEERRSKRSRRKGGEGGIRAGLPCNGRRIKSACLFFGLPGAPAGSECGLVQPRPAVEKGHFALGPGDHVPSGLRVSQAPNFMSATAVLGLIASRVRSVNLILKLKLSCTSMEFLRHVERGCAPDVRFQIRLGCIDLATNSRQFTGSVKHVRPYYGD